jgi:hypothetical protein
MYIEKLAHHPSADVIWGAGGNTYEKRVSSEEERRLFDRKRKKRNHTEIEAERVCNIRCKRDKN